MKHKKLIASIALCCLLFTSCGAKITNIKVELPESIAQGESISATLIAEYDKTDLNEEKKDDLLKAVEFTWTSSDEKIATVDKNGMVTGVSGGTATILLFGKGKESEYSFTTQINVTVSIKSISAPETLELILNKADSKKLDVKPMPENANIEGEITYKSNDETIATVSADGTVAAVSNGDTVITISAENKTAETKVIVTSAATGIGIESDAGWIYIGGSYELKPYTLPAEAAASTYTYTSDNTSVATVDDKGVITGKSAGTAQIIIKSAEGFETVYTVTIKAKPSGSKPGASTGGGTTAGGSNNTGGSTGGGTPSGGNAGGGTAPAPAPAPAPPEPQHYHGNGTDWGRCPVCGGSYSPSVGVGGGAGEDQGELQ